MSEKNKVMLADSSGVYVAATSEPRLCDNPVCGERAVVKDPSSGHWLCQHCHDEIYDTHWGFGHAVTLA